MQLEEIRKRQGKFYTPINLGHESRERALDRFHILQVILQGMAIALAPYDDDRLWDWCIKAELQTTYVVLEICTWDLIRMNRIALLL